MAGTPKNRGRETRKSQRGVEESPLVKWTLIALALAFVLLFLVLPLANVFVQALAKGGRHALGALADPDTQAAIRLTLLVAAIAVPLNVVFGLAAAFITRRSRKP